MSLIKYDCARSILEIVSFDSVLFYRELDKVIKTLLPYEIEKLKELLLLFIVEKPELEGKFLFVDI